MFAGQDLNNGKAFALEVNFNQADSPDIPKTLSVDIKVDNLTVEQCSDVIVSMANLIPDYRTVLRYGDLYKKPGNLDIQKRLR